MKIALVKVSLFFYAIVWVFSLPIQALADTENDSSFWFMSLARFEFDNGMRAFVDLQPRTAIESSDVGADGDLRQMLSRGALGYQITPDIVLFQGYAAIAEYERTRVEHRSFQELLASTPFEDLNITHRVRFEQRFLESVSGTSLRGRYFVRFTYPIEPLPDFSLAVNEEAFFNLNDRTGGPQAGFDQNRTFLGFNYRLNKTVSFDLGYQNQYIERRGGRENVSNHILFFGVLTTFRGL